MPRAALYSSKRVHVCEQIVDILLIQGLAIPGHFLAAVANDVGDALIIRRQAADRKVLVLENSFEARTIPSPGGVRLVAAVAVAVIDLAAGRLLGIQPEFGIRLAPFHVTGTEHEYGGQRPKGKQNLRATFPIRNCVS